MADFGKDLAGEAPPVDIIENPTPEQQGELAKQWETFIADPGARSALMQFGLQAMQPLAVGQTSGGALAQAIGSGAAAGGRQVGIEEAQANKEIQQGQAERRLGQADAALDFRRDALDRRLESAEGISAADRASREATAKTRAGATVEAAQVREKGRRERRKEVNRFKRAATRAKLAGSTYNTLVRAYSDALEFGEKLDLSGLDEKAKAIARKLAPEFGVETTDVRVGGTPRTRSATGAPTGGAPVATPGPLTWEKFSTQSGGKRLLQMFRDPKTTPEKRAAIINSMRRILETSPDGKQVLEAMIQKRKSQYGD